MASVESGGRSVFSTSSAPHACMTYMHRPPRIMPNYGRKTRGALPKSNVSRVLLYDNVTQQQMLQVKISHLHVEKRKAGHLLDLHRKSFIIRRLQTQKHVGENPERHTYHLHLRKEPQLSFTHAKASSLCLDAHNSGADRPEVTSFTKHDDISVETEEKLRQHPDLRKLAQKDEECSSHRGLPVSAVSQDHQTSGNGVLRKSPDHAHHVKRRNQAHGFQSLQRDDAGTIKLPDISRRFAAASGETGSVGHVLLTSDSSSYGVTRVLHTFPAPVDQKGGKALARCCDEDCLPSDGD
ncbi:uncharacterized protein LOC112559851 [Pomacea canaliculata]|nr:uncharacterized protein LOC112559851 [Pomacea canaliculata]